MIEEILNGVRVGGVTLYDDLEDTPDDKTGYAGQVAIVSDDELSLIFGYTLKGPTATRQVLRLKSTDDNVANNIFEALSSTDDVLFSITPDGKAGVNTGDPDTMFEGRSDFAIVRINQDSDLTSYLDIRDQSSFAASFSKITGIAGSSVLDFNALPSDGVSLAQVRFFRSTDTTGLSSMIVHVGDGTSGVAHQFNSDGSVVHNGAGNSAGIFRVEGDNNPNLIITDPVNELVGFGTPSSPTAKVDINSDILRLRTPKTVSSPTDAGNQGDIAWDADYAYICVATNSWKRIPLEDFGGPAGGGSDLFGWASV